MSPATHPSQVPSPLVLDGGSMTRTAPLPVRYLFGHEEKEEVKASSTRRS